MSKGTFITFEGGEGSGKSTQIRLLGDYLKIQKYDVVLTREPGGTETGEGVRAIILTPGVEKALITELLLFSAARAQYVTEIVRPALEKGQVILSDRFYDSTTVYQGYAGGLPLDDVHKINKLATGNLVPDLTFVLDVPVEIGLERTIGEFGQGTQDFIDLKGRDFHTKVNEAFRTIARLDPYPQGRMVLVEYKKGDIDGMQQHIRHIALEYLTKSR
ncbi:MAG: dTMP kinase [Nanoarchaeota archaeon]